VPFTVRGKTGLKYEGRVDSMKRTALAPCQRRYRFGRLRPAGADVGGAHDGVVEPADVVLDLRLTRSAEALRC